MPTGMMGQNRKARADVPRSSAARAVVGHSEPLKEVPNMATQPKMPKPAGQPIFAARIWHWRAKKYLNASDYGFKAFPIRKGR